MGMKQWLILAAAAAATAWASPAAAFTMAEARLDLKPLLAAPGKGRPVLPLFEALVVADLTGEGRKEIILPDSSHRLHVLRVAGTPSRPTLTRWTAVETRVEGDQLAAGECYLTAAPLAKGAPSSLVLALPRGIFSLKFEGPPPRVEWVPFCDRILLEPGTASPAPQRLDFLIDVDGDGDPELLMPQLEGMILLKRKAGGASWEEMQPPPQEARARQTEGAQLLRSSAALPAIYALGFQSSLTYPAYQFVDLTGDGRPELVVQTRETDKRPTTVRAECFELRDALHYSTSPVQVRVAPTEGAQEFLDLNGDGFLDLLRVESNLDIVSPRTAISVFLSPPQREFVFDQPTQRYQTQDPIGVVLYGDWNRDGKTDLAFSQFEYTFGSTDDLISLILGREIKVSLRFLHGGPEGFPPKPDQDVRLQIRNRSFSPLLFPPLTLEGDFNGDGRADLLVRARPDRCDVYLSGPDGRIAARPAGSFSVGAESMVRISDLDGDGKSDVLTLDDEEKLISVFLARP